MAQNEIAPRFERIDGVAAVNVNGGLRRQIHVDLSKEKITALNLSVNQVVASLRQENQNTPLGEIYQGDATFLVRSQGQFQSVDDIRNLVVMTRQGVPVYLQGHRRRAGHHRTAPPVHAHQRPPGDPDPGAEAVGQEHRRGRRAGQGRGRARQPRSARHAR